MSIRYIASGIILLGFGYMGMLFAGRYKTRVRQLELLQNAMTQLDHDIDFLNIPLSESFLRIANSGEGVLRELFLYVSNRLSQSPGCDMQKLWQRAMSKYDSCLALTAADKQIIVDFSKMVGSGNREKEKNNIRVTAMRIELALTEAKTEAQKNVKMYRGLGVLMGVFAVIVLF